MKFMLLILAAATSYAMTLPARAQAPNALPAGVPAAYNDHGPALRVTVPPAPPADFDPTMASQGTLQYYGIPPAPAATAPPEHHASWQKIVAAMRKTSHLNIEPRLTNITHGPTQANQLTQAAGSNAATSQTSPTWSGSVVVDTTNHFGTIVSGVGTQIVGSFIVPAAHQPLNTCTGGWVYSAAWVGIDGFNIPGAVTSPDVFQAGVDAAAYCNNGSTASEYYAWIEWYPDNAIIVPSPVVSPGDWIQVTLWPTSTTTGFINIYNASKEISVSYNITAPTGTALIGNTIEWIVERPSINNVYSQLTNYYDMSWPNGFALASTNPQLYYMGGPNPTGTTYSVTMTDNNNNPISSASFLGPQFLFFTNYGSSCGNLAYAAPC